jgi:hypothetical protein
VSTKLVLELKSLLAAGLTQAEVLTALSECGDTPLYLSQVEEARNEYCDDECEIDDHPLVSVADREGVWISAWLWVAIPAVEETEEHHIEQGTGGAAQTDKHIR